MRFISTRFHGVLDYLMGIFLLAAPWLLNFNDGGAAQYVPMIVGAMIILLSFFTNYEADLSKTISMSTHLTMDILAGIVLAASPWLFGFASEVYLPHLILGIMEIGAGLFTARTPHTSHYAHTTGVRHAH
ncbi:SPW repeat protein [Arcticibacter sp. MXS-1]|uniref:SPW repeat domain-containing protein n=1 Tax=Arcticibacter sp. MXS-1 TaxID=3341726 RepID=UPI0035A82368